MSGRISRNMIAGACLFLSGCAGLIYEICWIRKATLVFGSTTYAFSTLLAVFFFGLSSGSYLFGRAADRTQRPLRLFALIELCIGLLALATPFGFSFADRIYGLAYQAAADQFALLTLVRICLIALILLPPTILMGGSLPLFCSQYVHEEARIAKGVGIFYGLNTLGAAVGAAATGLTLLPGIGTFGSICIGAGINLVVAAIAALLSRDFVIKREALKPALPPVERRAPAGVFVLLFLIGFVSLGNEVLWSRHLALLIRNTVYTYTLTLTAVLIGIVLGSAGAALLFDRSRSRAFWLGALQAAAGVVTLGLMLIPADFWARFDPLPLSTYFFLLLPPAVLSGAAFPLGVRMVVEDPAFVGIGVGRLSAANTLGGIAGSLFVGFAALPALGQQSTLLAITGLSLAGGFLAWILLEHRLSLALRWSAVAASLVVWIALPFAFGTRLPVDFLVNEKLGEHLLGYREGLSSDVGIIQDYRGIRELQINRLWQGQDRKTEQIMVAHVPMLLHEDLPRSVLLVGLGAGQTANRFLMYRISRLDCVDIEPAVFGAIREYFDSAWMNDPRVRLLSEDGRNYLAHSGDTYDVISIEVGQIFRPGVPLFYTSEFYEQAKERLNPGGFLTQMVSIQFYTPEQFRSVVATFQHVFPQSFLWYNGDDFLLIGAKMPRLRLNGDRLALLGGGNIVSNDLRFSLIAGRPEFGMNQRFVFLGSFITGPQGLARLGAGAPLYRDDRPALDYAVSGWTPRKTYDISTIALLRTHLDSIKQFIGTEISNAEWTKIEQTRTADLDDLVAHALFRTL